MLAFISKHWFLSICFLIFSILLLFHLTTKKYLSPYHFIIKFGKPGCGKTTDMVRLRLEYQRKGWTVYCNTKIDVPGVRIFDTQDFGLWVDNNSVILIDELNLYFDNRSFKTFSKQALEYTRLYRHNQVIIIGYSQTFDCDKKLRDMADEMYLMYKFMRVFTVSKKIRKVLTIRQAEYRQDSDSQVVDNLEFESILLAPWGSRQIHFMPKYYKYFDTYSKPINVNTMPYYEIPQKPATTRFIDTIKEIINNWIYGDIDENIPDVDEGQQTSAIPLVITKE